jgi:hypothetical protein
MTQLFGLQEQLKGESASYTIAAQGCTLNARSWKLQMTVNAEGSVSVMRQ